VWTIALVIKHIMNLLALCWTLLTFSSGLVSLLICVDLSVSLSAKFVFVQSAISLQPYFSMSASTEQISKNGF